MTRKTSIITELGNYFASKGAVMTADEYKNAEDAPIRFVLVKRAIGSWSRLLNMIGDLSQYDGTPPEEVVHNNVDSEVEESVEEQAEEPVEEPEETPAPVVVKTPEKKPLPTKE